MPAASLLSPLVFLTIVFLCSTLALTAVQRFLLGGHSGSLLAQIAVNGLASGGVVLLLPLIFVLLSGKFSLDVPTLLTTILSLLIVLCLFLAERLYRRERVLRTTLPTDIAHLPDSGFVRVSGRTSAPQGVVASDVGKIPGIYVREHSFRYQADIHRSSGTPRWYPRHHRLQTADFLITDETGSILVEASKATFYPLRVARFYNDIPVEEFFEDSYSGDLRTEVFFIPAEANVTVWGRCFETSSPFPGTAERRIGLDVLSDTLIVVEENPGRLFTHRPLFGLLLTLTAVLLSFGVILCVIAPGIVTHLLSGGGLP